VKISIYIDARRMSVDQVFYSLVYRAFIRLLQGELAENTSSDERANYSLVAAGKN